MTPALIRLRNVRPGELSTATLTSEAETMHIQNALYSRSVTGTNNSSGGLDRNTIIFIVLGVVCLLVILLGFYVVGRPRAACNAVSNVPSHPQHSPIILPPRPRSKRDMSEHWKTWGIWRYTSSTDPQSMVDSPTSRLSSPSATIAVPSRIIHAREGSKANSPIAPRPSQSRRITSLSVATSFSNSHITEEALSDFCASAYDLDGDLETEMLHSARDDVWVGHPLAVEDGRGGVEMGVRGDATFVEGGVEGDPPTRLVTQSKDDDYEKLGDRQKVASGSNGVESGVGAVDKVIMGR